MLAKYILNKLTADRSPELLSGRCINQRQQQVQCQVCRFVCPNRAISGLEAVRVDGTRCDGCGICAAACPARCLIPSSFPGHIPETVMPGKACVVGCEYGAGAVNVRVFCLAGQPWEFFAAIVILRKYQPVELDLSSCPECTRKKGVWRLLCSLEKLRLFLGEKQYRESVHLRLEKQHFQHSISRREIFGFLRRETTVLAREMSRSLLRLKNDDKVNPYRRLLERVISGRGVAGSAAHYRLPAWEVGEQCRGCGFCQAVCPQAAWEMTAGQDGKALLLFRPWRCTECGLCARLCAVGAKEKGDRTAGCGTGTTLVAKVFVLSDCRKCHSRNVMAGNELCTQCAKREELKKSLLKI